MRVLMLKSVAILALMGCEAGAPATTVRGEVEDAVAGTEKMLASRAGAVELPQCRGGETRVYACNFGERRVAVCAAPGRLSYRFGDDHKTDLEIVSRPGRVRAHVGGVVGGGGGSQTAIRFSNNGYHYIVHSMEAGSLTDVPGQRFSGVTVVRGEGIDAPVVRSLECPQKTDAQAFGSGVDLPEGTWEPEEGETWSGWW